MLWFLKLRYRQTLSCGSVGHRTGGMAAPSTPCVFPWAMTADLSLSRELFSPCLNSGAIRAPICLHGCEPLRGQGWSCTPAAGVDVLRVLLIRVFMVAGKRDGGI